MPCKGGYIVGEIPNIPNLEQTELHWCHQFTIPLLFDDCLSLLQKVCALWAKTNEIISSLEEWNVDFSEWAAGVEGQLSELKEKYTSLVTRIVEDEKNISNIQKSLETIDGKLSNILTRLQTVENNVSNLSNRVSTVENNMKVLQATVKTLATEVSDLKTRVNDLSDRITALEELLENLNIIPPQEIYNTQENDTAWKSCWNNWFNWFATYVVTFNSRLPASGWEMSSNLTWYDTVTKPGRLIQIGYLGQPVCRVKLPFIAVYKNAFESAPTLDNVAEYFPSFKKTALNPANAFFTFAQTKAFGYTMDEVKLATSYIPYLPSGSYLYKVELGSSKSCLITKSIECDVRMQIQKTGTVGKLCVIPRTMTFGIVPSQDFATTGHYDAYIYAIAENG